MANGFGYHHYGTVAEVENSKGETQGFISVHYGYKSEEKSIGYKHRGTGDVEFLYLATKVEAMLCCWGHPESTILSYEFNWQGWQGDQNFYCLTAKTGTTVGDFDEQIRFLMEGKYVKYSTTSVNCRGFCRDLIKSLTDVEIHDYIWAGKKFVENDVKMSYNIRQSHTPTAKEIADS